MQMSLKRKVSIALKSNNKKCTNAFQDEEEESDEAESEEEEDELSLLSRRVNQLWKNKKRRFKNFKNSKDLRRENLLNTKDLAKRGLCAMNVKSLDTTRMNVQSFRGKSPRKDLKRRKVVWLHGMTQTHQIKSQTLKMS